MPCGSLRWFAVLHRIPPPRPRDDVSELTGNQIELDHSYVVGEPVHTGGMATMYEATWTVFDQPVYVRACDGLPRLRLRYRTQTRIREAVEERVGRIRGPHLPDVIDAGHQDETRPFLVMRLPAGGLLSRRVNARDRMDAEPVAAMLDAVAKALRTYRDAETPHRGPTPDRVWLGDDGDVVLLGFGEVLYRDDSITMSGPAESAHVWHLPPESFAREEPDPEPGQTRTGRLRAISASEASAVRAIEDDPRAEVYAMGALAYFALNGHHPFFLDARDPGAGITATLSDDPLELRDHPDGTPVAAEIARAMDRDPEARHASPRAFADAFAAAIATAPLDDDDAFDDVDDDPARPVEHASGAVDAAVDDAVLGDLRAALWLWRFAALVLLVGVAGAIMLSRMRATTIVVTSEPSGVELEEMIGHTAESRGETPVLLRGRPAGQPVTLRVVGPDGARGEPRSFLPAELDDLGRCRGVGLQLAFDDGTAGDDDATDAPPEGSGAP